MSKSDGRDQGKTSSVTSWAQLQRVIPPKTPRGKKGAWLILFRGPWRLGEEESPRREQKGGEGLYYEKKLSSKQKEKI